MLMLHLEPQSQRGRFQTLPARDSGGKVAQIIRIRQLAVDEPTELSGRLGST